MVGRRLRHSGAVSSVLTPAVRAALSLPRPLITAIAGAPPTIDGNTLDPAVHFLLYLEARGVGGPQSHDPVVRRATMDSNGALVMPRISGVTVQEHLLAGRIRAREYRARDLHGPAPVIVYFHGGGWVVGSLDSHDGTCRALARASGCVVVAVDYRLAPEHPFPAGLDDAQAAFTQVHDHPERFGGIPGAVAVMGDSAGANLAAALCLRTRDDGPAPVAQLLVYPAVDLRLDRPSIATFGEGFFLSREDMHWFRDQYLTAPSQIVHPEVSPLLADDLSGLPPAAIWTAGFDPLRDEGQAYAAALREAGNEVVEVCLRDQIHGFFGMGVLPGGMQRIAGVCARAGRFVREAMT